MKSLIPLSFLSLLSLVSLVLSTPFPRSRGWRSLSPIPVHPRQEHSTVALSPSELAIIGGIVPNPGGQPGFATTTLVQVYDIPSDSWRTAAPLPLPMNHPNAAVVDGKLYVLGGLTPDPMGSWNATSRCFTYSPMQDTWSEIPSMPLHQARGSATMGVSANKNIILAGGMEVLVPGPGNEQRTVSTVTSYNTETREWSVLPSLPEERDHAAGAVIAGHMYVLGGRRFGQLNVTDTVYSLSLEGPSGWALLPARMPTPRGGLAAGTVSLRGRDGSVREVVYTFGGEGNPEDGMDGVFDEVEAFEPSADGGRWWSEGRMLVKKHGTAAVGIGGTVYIPGGGSTQGGSPVSDFEAYAPGGLLRYAM